MKVLLIVATFFSISAYSQSKAEISAMLDKMKASGTFTPAQIEAAKKKLNGMSDKDMQKIINAGKAKMNDPKVKEKLKTLQMPDGV